MHLFLRRCPILGTLHLFVLFCAATAGAERAHADTITVTSTADSGAGSLRDAIAAASDGDTIQFDTALNGQTIILTNGELVIDKNISISGPGSNVLTVERDQQVSAFRIFYVMPGQTVTIAGLTISGGYASGSFGAGVLNNGATLTISNCIVSGNVSDGGDGGGGIYNQEGVITIIDSAVSFNRATFTFGFPIGYGGGISSGGTLTIIRSTISNNTADIHGGGIVADGVITITDSTISANEAGSPALQSSGIGGGLYSGGTVEIRNSTISGNTASGGDGSGLGGGIVSGGGGTLIISNSTISGNFANQDGGAILSNAPLTITNSTISDNWADRNGGGIINYAGLEIENTILNAGASGANIFNSSGGTVTSLGYNLSSDDGGGFLTAAGDQINTNPIVGPLQDNGGPTFTHGLLTGSPALDAGDPNFTPPPLYDQRGPGYHRVFNGRIDIGSLEVQPAPTPTPTPTATPTPAPSPAQALNISTRLRVESGNNVLIGGFIITGNAPKNVAVRGIGPSLAAFGISDFLADPTLELRAANGALLAQNEDWQDDPAQAAQLTNLGLALQHPNESGLLATLQPGASYTAILAGNNGGTGVGLVEIYDADPGADAQLANISTRGFVQTGNNVMIGGFILGGSSNNTQVAVRGIGPSLAQIGLSPVLSDPTLELRDANGALLISNDDWQDDPASASQLAFHGLALQDPNESGVFASLPPGAFTAILAGNSGGMGIGLLEIYNVQ